MNINLSRASFRGLSLALLALLGCETVTQDDFASRDGISPDPTGIIEGSVVYNGPAPTCVYENGVAARVIGNVVLNLYASTSAPFPEGPAVSSVNQLVVSGDRLFDLDDCLPDGARPRPDVRISSSVPFVWSRLALAPEADVTYQIRGFYDYGEDFNPLFIVRRLPTAGDVLGAARADVTSDAGKLADITLLSQAAAPNGVVRRGITVVLDAPVTTERPAFRLGDEHRLAADAAFVPDADPGASLRRFRALTCSDPSRGNGVDCGLSVSLLPRTDGPKLEAVGVRLAQTDPAAYSLYVDAVDLTTVRNEDIDVPGADGRIDPHPALGPTLGIDWYAPMVFLTRRRTPQDDSAAIPNVRFIGSLLLDEDAPARGTNLGSGPVPVVVPPMAFVEWTSASPSTSVCRVPYVAPRTPAAVTAGRLAHCGELPTGSYDVTLISGATGGVPGGEGARPSYLSWTVPNELGDPLQLPAAEARIASQGLDSTFQVVDPPGGPSTASCDAQQGVVCAGNTLPVVEPEPGRGLDSATCLPRSCCAAIEHLCGVPLCDREVFAEGSNAGYIRGPKESELGPPNLAGVRKPACVPFEMPRQCCGNDRAPSR